VTRWSCRALVVAGAVLAASVLPVATSWSAPSVRLAEVAAAVGNTVALPHPSSHLGVRWLGDHDDAVQLRWRAAGGHWSDWRDVEPADDLGDERRGVVLSGLVLAADASEAELRVLAGSPRALEVVAIDTRHGPRRLTVDRPPAASAYTPGARVAEPAVVSRAEWGADESTRREEPIFAPIVRMGVHHTATENDDPDPAATLRAIQAYHVHSNGWNDIGYNFLVDAQGRIYEGRYARAYLPGEAPTGEDTSGQGVVGAHMAGNNTGTVGVALLGTFTSEPPRQPALDALVRLLAWKADRHGVNPSGTTTWTTGEHPTIVGHRDAVATACPGDRLYGDLPAVRAAVADTIANSRGLARLAGEGRIETAVALSRQSFPAAPAVVVARSDAYADALAAAPLAAQAGGPVLLTTSRELAPAVDQEVRRLGAGTAFLAGGASALSPEVELGLLAAGVTEVVRIDGANRFDTARLIALRVGGPSVYLAEGDNPDPARGWPDAVAVSGLAASQRRPILLVTRDDLPAETRAALGELGAREATVVGGPAAVSEAVAAAAADYDRDGIRQVVVTRVAGETRYETSRLLADRAVTAGASPSRTWLATGLGWPDALAAGQAVAARGGILVLAHGAELRSSPPTEDWLRTHGRRLEELALVGGAAAISRFVEGQVLQAAT
jgi:hypothetical protein